MLRKHPILTGLLLTVLALGGTGWFAERVMGQPITCNILRFLGAAPGSDPAVVASGCDTNININLVPKGTGVVKIAGTPIFVGTTNVIPRFTSATSLGDSFLFEDLTNFNILFRGGSNTGMAAFIAANVATGTLVADSGLALASPGVFGPGLTFTQLRGTYSAPTKSLINNGLGFINFFGWSGSALIVGPVLQAVLLTDGAAASPFYELDIFGHSNLDTIKIGTNSTTPELVLTNARVTMLSAGQLAWSTDLVLTRNAAATLQLGAADAAAPVAQALTVQSVVAGTTDTAGAAWLFKGSRGTGTGVGGDVGIQVAYPGLTGTAQNTLTTVVNASAANASANALQTLVSVTPIVNQTGTASYTAFDVNLTRTAVGSGLGQLLALRVGGVQRWGFTDGATGVGTQMRATQATAPTCSANCGTTVPAVVGTDFSMVATMGSGGVPVTPFTVTLNGTYTTTPSCQAVAKVTTTAFVTKVAPTATTVVVTTATNPAVNDSYNIVCTPVA